MKKYLKVQLLIQELLDDDFITILRMDEVCDKKSDIVDILREFYKTTDRFIDKKIKDDLNERNY